MLARKFAYYFLLPLLTMLALGGVAVYSATTWSLRGQQNRSLLATVRALDHAISRQVESIRDDLYVMAKDPQMDEYYQFVEHGRLEDADRRLLDLEEDYVVVAQLKPKCKSFRLFDAHGNSKISVVDFARDYRAFNVARAPWFRAAVQLSSDQDAYVVSDVHPDLTFGKPCLTVARAVWSRNRVHGVLCVEIFVTDLCAAQMKDALAPAGGHVYVVDPAGRVQASMGDDAPPVGSQSEGYATQRVLAGAEGVTSADTDRLTVFLPQSKTVLGLVLAVPTDALFAPVHRMRTVFLLISLVGVFAVGGMGFWLVRRQVEPIRMLTDRVERVAAGDLDVTIDVRTGDEIEILAHDFNGMTRSLRESRRALEDRAEQLETAYNRLEKTQRQLDHAEKMSVLGQLAGGIAHDFNNLLGGIIGAADLLRRNTISEEDRAEYLEMILESGTRAADLIHQLLAFARPGLKTRETVDLHGLIDKVVLILRRTVDPRVEVRKHLRAEVTTIVGDPTALQSALLNLGVNARDAMPDGGKLTFTTSVVHLDEETCRRLPHGVTPGEYIEVDVSDTGVGIAKELQGRIFEPFFTTKDVGSGTGLGLAAVYGTVKGHKGTLNLYSEPGEGTVFSLYFPTSPDAVTASVAPPALVEGTGRILLVDDEPVIRNIARDMLRSMGYEVLLAEHGRQALDIYEKRSGEIDLVILDLVMPGMNGKEVLRGMKRIRPSGRVLIASGFNLEADMPDVRREGACGFLSKPFISADLSQAVAAALRSTPGSVATLHVLVVDDSRVYRDVVAAQLKSLGHTVQVAENGETAVELVTSQTFDLVIMDDELPGISGLEATEAIRRNESDTGGHVPIIGMSGHNEPEEKERCQKVGMNGFLGKPASIEELQAEIARVLS